MKKIMIAAAGCVVAAAGVAAVVLSPQFRDYLWPEVKAADAPAPAAPPPGVPVTAGVVEAKDVPVFLSGIGSVQAYNMVTIKTRVDGQITAVRFEEGQSVRAGDAPVC